MKQLRSLERINMGLSRAAATAPLRRIDPTDPRSWEFAGFSQHGEDGLTDYLLSQLTSQNRYFVEIGIGNGLENNTAWLALARTYGGLMIDGNAEDVEWCQYMLTPYNYGIKFREMFVTLKNVPEIVSLAQHRDPDFFSLDIDGNDYHIVKSLLENGMRPKIWALEYNSVFGPTQKIAIRYQEEFRLVQRPGDSIYWGCSMEAWKLLLKHHGYHFVTADQSGVNAYFIDPNHFDPGFVAGIRGVPFLENYSHAREYGAGWEKQFALIQDREYIDVT